MTMLTTSEVLGISGPLQELLRKIHARTALIGIVGLGYVGLPLAVAARKTGYSVAGLDNDPNRVATLRKGRSYITDVTDGEVALLSGNSISTDEQILEAADIVLITVPTPLVDHTPDLSFVREATQSTGRTLRPGNLVILESTTYPGTTEEVVRPLLEQGSGLTIGVDFALAYSPERINPGQDDYSVEDIPKVVGGLTETCRDLAVSFYQSFIREVVATSGPREAEMAKLIENTFRHVNVALVNELAILARELDLDIWEAIRAAATKPFGFMPFWPGPGVGGHCIPIDPSYLSWRVSQVLGYSNGFIEHANQINRRMPRYVVDRIAEALNEEGKPLKEARILAVGAAYKPGVGDSRESPALAVIEQLCKRGALVSYHDRYVPEVSACNVDLVSVPLEDVNATTYDCIVILTPHPDIDWARLATNARVLFDARGVTTRMDAPNIVRL